MKSDGIVCLVHNSSSKETMQTRSAAPMKYVMEFSASQDVSRGKSASQISWQLEEEE
jgi:hypothetical protein